VERLRSLYERRGRDCIFATFTISGAGAEVLSAFRAQHPEGPCEYPDPAERIVFWNQLFGNRPQVSDDSLPSAYLTEMDQGLYGGLLGAEVHFNCNPVNGWISSMVAPVLQDWSGFEKLSFTTSHQLFRRYTRQLEVFTAGADGKFGVCPCVQINGLNFVYELVGAMQTYMSLLDSPDAVTATVSSSDSGSTRQ
jgi:hypothetical protein